MWAIVDVVFLELDAKRYDAEVSRRERPVPVCRLHFTEHKRYAMLIEDGVVKNLQVDAKVREIIT